LASAQAYAAVEPTTQEAVNQAFESAHSRNAQFKKDLLSQMAKLANGLIKGFEPAEYGEAARLLKSIEAKSKAKECKQGLLESVTKADSGKPLDACELTFVKITEVLLKTQKQTETIFKTAGGKEGTAFQGYIASLHDETQLAIANVVAATISKLYVSSLSKLLAAEKTVPQALSVACDRDPDSTPMECVLSGMIYTYDIALPGALKGAKAAFLKGASEVYQSVLNANLESGTGIEKSI
jgi:hypothetical protein